MTQLWPAVQGRFPHHGQHPPPLAASTVLCLAPILVIVASGIGMVTFLVEAMGIVLSGTANAMVDCAVVPGTGIAVGIAVGIAYPGYRLQIDNEEAKNVESPRN